MTVALSRRMRPGSQETKMFEAWKMYRHRNSLDLDMLVVSVIGEDRRGITMQVRYFNRFHGFFQPSPSSTPDEVTVKRAHLENWKVV